MAIISMESPLEAVCSGSHVEVGIKLGLAASLLYHLFCQFPRQAEVAKCLMAIVSINVLFWGILKFTGPMHTIPNLLVGLVVFNMTLVNPF